MTDTIIVLLFSIFAIIHSGNGLSQGAMLNRHLRKSHYDINETPYNNERTNISVQLFINSFGSLNAASMDYSLDTFLRQRWVDPRLNMSNSNMTSLKITVMDKKVQDKIWKPDTFFENVKDAKIHTVTMPNILLRINLKDGSVLYSIRMKMTMSCMMDFNKYPFDKQNCYTALASYANTDDVLKYQWAVPAVDIPKTLTIAQFCLFKRVYDEKTYHYETGNFSGLRVLFHLRRQNGYHILQTYIPTILIVSISWVSFWLDPNAVPGRISLGVTTLLTLTTLASGIRQQLPPVSYVKAIDVWVGMCMIMVFGALLEFTLVNWLANKKVQPDRRKCALPGIFKCLWKDSDEDGIKNSDNTVDGPATYMSHARAFDRFSRVLFPGGFFLFNLYYWPYYLLQQKSLLSEDGEAQQ